MAAGDIPHQFTIQLPRDVALDEVRERLLRSLGLCHGASVLREPRVQPAADGALEITVFVLSREFASRAEACARRTVETFGPNAVEDVPVFDTEAPPDDHEVQ